MINLLKIIFLLNILILEKNFKININEDLLKYLQLKQNNIFIYLQNICKNDIKFKIKLCKIIKLNMKNILRNGIKSKYKSIIAKLFLICKNKNNKICKKFNKLTTKYNKNALIKHCSNKNNKRFCHKLKHLYILKLRKLYLKPHLYFITLKHTCNKETDNLICKIGYYILLKWVNIKKNSINI